VHVKRLWAVAASAAVLAAGTLACGGSGDDDGGDEDSNSVAPTVLGASSSPDDGALIDGDCVQQAYEVQDGDTLSLIAEQFERTVEAIAGASGISNPDALQVGQELTIPCPGQLPSTPDASQEEAEESPAADS
jgi:LysM repeat protein